MTCKLTQLATCSLCMRSTDFSALKSQLMERNYKLQFIIIIMERNLILFSSEGFDWNSFLSEDNITKTTSEDERRYASLIWLKEIELQLKSANHTLRLFDRLVIKSWIQCFREQTRQKFKRRTIMAHDLRNQFPRRGKRCKNTLAIAAVFAIGGVGLLIGYFALLGGTKWATPTRDSLLDKEKYHRMFQEEVNAKNIEGYLKQAQLSSTFFSF